jgi:hypothetical protein
LSPSSFLPFTCRAFWPSAGIARAESSTPLKHDLLSIVTWQDREIRFADSDDQVDADSPG